MAKRLIAHMHLHKTLKRAKKEQTLAGRIRLKVGDKAREKTSALAVKQMNKLLEDPSDAEYDSEQ